MKNQGYIKILKMNILNIKKEHHCYSQNLKNKTNIKSVLFFLFHNYRMKLV